MNDLTLFSLPSTNMFSQSGSIDMFLTDLFTLCSCHSYSDSDMQVGKSISWPIACSCTVSSVFWRHHFMSRSGRQRNHCCLV